MNVLFEWIRSFSSSAGAIGIADGVGSWVLRGVNPKDFADELMEGCKASALAMPMNGLSYLMGVFFYT